MGATGPQGPQGPQGAQGPVGPAGPNYALTWNLYSGNLHSRTFTEFVVDCGSGYAAYAMSCGNPNTSNHPNEVEVNYSGITTNSHTAVCILTNNANNSENYQYGVLCAANSVPGYLNGSPLPQDSTTGQGTVDDILTNWPANVPNTATRTILADGPVKAVMYTAPLNH